MTTARFSPEQVARMLGLPEPTGEQAGELDRAVLDPWRRPRP